MEQVFGEEWDPAFVDPADPPPAFSSIGGLEDRPVRLNGRYELGRELGRGGEASVYAATDLQLGRQVAVKLFHRRVLPPSEGRLEQIEARVSATLNHYALTMLLDSGADVGPEGAAQLFTVMEFVPGENLRARLLRGAMSPSEACWLGFDLAEGLDYLHQTGFIHRDVKPANILISSQRSVRFVVAKLTDFGITVAVGEPDLREFTTGTAAYLSPEQVEGNDAVPASDVYSLGLVLLEAMTGRPEFPGTVTASAFARLSRDPLIPDWLPEWVQRLLERMTVRAPAARIALFDAAVELQQILVDDLLARRGRALEEEPVPPEPRSVGSVTGQARPGLETSARLAAHALGAPMAAVVLHTADGPTLAASVGFAEPPTALASGVIRGSRDGRGSWTVADLRAVGGIDASGALADVVSAAGTSIIGADRTELGVLLVCDTRTRPFPSAQLAALRDGAELIATDLQLRLAIRRVLFPDA